MIPVDEAEQPQQALGPPPVRLRVLDESEQAKVDYIDAAIEPIAAQAGEMFDVKLASSFVTMEVVHALKQRWEAGGWCVGVFKLSDSVLQVVFARPKSGKALSEKAITKALEAREPKTEVLFRAVPCAPEAPQLSTPLLLRMPTRGRPGQALQVLAAYRELAANPVAIEVVIDEDDETMNTTQVLQRLYDLDCSITVGRHASKIEAVNAGRVNDWAILALVSDDMVPVAHGYDWRIQQAMRENFPLLDGLIYFNDGYNKDHVRDERPILCTLPIFGRHLYDQFGYVYFPRYGSLYSDDEQTELLIAMRRAVFVDELLIEHRHHAAGKAANDALYQFNDSKWGTRDRALFEQRSQLRVEHSQFPFGAPPLWLSILVCSTEARASRLRKLVDYLQHQMRAFPRQVELCVSVDDGTMSIGEKRQRLLERAVGHFVAFVDDDDWVASDYVQRIVHAITRDPTVDCCSLWGVLTMDGERPEQFHHSIEYSAWRTNSEGLHERYPNHLNAVRRELALKARFPSKDFGEDHDFSTALRPMLKREATIDGVLYHYWARTKKELGA